MAIGVNTYKYLISPCPQFTQSGALMCCFGDEIVEFAVNGGGAEGVGESQRGLGLLPAQAPEGKWKT